MDKEQIIAHCLTYMGAYEDYPFSDTWTVMRHTGSKKSFAFIYHREGHWCANLKCEPLRAAMLRDLHEDVKPAYHMNKEHWNTVILDGGLDEEDIFDLVRHSFDLTKPKIPKKKREQEADF
ncbi:MmcQ/YjbR family DNA-binding protein [Saccharibacillus sp. CPCC 101409]|uniref:MmcQ/YjbR family DNA-binding protein n=1 Tax=Saccharibacillus sp. CPCC 101409 TaxID=3058041 RepID=UPI0026711B8D|nr:MmcQ/YjbR family DNA-binding protein [Saccharibacillus sp. CPCC 101409]MDO3413261.1 MmcQ/YjbR family DNA-binding protein [Saccharibacillus sp. CPCC 101409]